jgi:hypothetical protein
LEESSQGSARRANLFNNTKKDYYWGPKVVKWLDGQKDPNWEMTSMCILWLVGLIKGDGYIDDRHVEIYNSSEDILRKSIKCLRRATTGNIKVDIYTKKPQTSSIEKWSKILDIDKQNVKMKKDTSPWKSRTEKIRLRVASKTLSDKIQRIKILKRDYGCYLKGLFDAEASVDVKGYIEFKQVKKGNGPALVNDVFKALNTLGINTSEPKEKRDNLNKKTDCYIYVKDLEAFKEKIGFTDSQKTNKLNILLKVKTRNHKKSIPKEEMSIWELMDYTCLPYHKLRRMHTHLTVRQTR